MAEWKIEPLAPHHDRSGFDCGNRSLDTWIERYASQDVKRGLCRTYVLVRPPQARVVGFYSLSGGAIAHEALPTSFAKKYPLRLVIPSVLLGRLAIDRSHQGQGLGNFLLYNALTRVQRTSELVGIFAVTVDAADESARNYYVHHDFITLLDDPYHLFCPLNDIRKLGLPTLPDSEDETPMEPGPPGS